MRGMGPYTNAKECNEKRKNKQRRGFHCWGAMIPYPTRSPLFLAFSTVTGCSTPTVSLGVFAPVGEGKGHQLRGSSEMGWSWDTKSEMQRFWVNVPINS